MGSEPTPVQCVPPSVQLPSEGLFQAMKRLLLIHAATDGGINTDSVATGLLKFRNIGVVCHTGEDRLRQPLCPPGVAPHLGMSRAGDARCPCQKTPSITQYDLA